MAGVQGEQLFTSVDSGVTWTLRDSVRNWTSVASSSDGTKLVAAVISGQLYTSTDSGVNWTARMTDVNRDWFSVASSADGTKLVAGVQVASFTPRWIRGELDAREAILNWQSLASSADGTKLVAAVFNGQLYTSVDSGVTWTQRDSVRPWYSVASSGGRHEAGGGGVWRPDLHLGGRRRAGLSDRERRSRCAAVSLTGISSGPANESAQTLSFSATSSDTSIVPTPTFTYTSANTTGTLNFTPAANANGTVTITVVLSDGGGTANGGVEKATNSFVVNLTALNDQPTLDPFGIPPIGVASTNSSSASTGTSITFSHNPGSGPDRLLLVTVGLGDNNNTGAAGFVTGVTFGGTPMFLVGSNALR